jgi:predicted porin
MKKTLIALAAVAVSSAAMAQVTVSGKLRFAYEASKSAASPAVKKNGLGVTDGDIVFASKEDLGGGMTMTADMALRLRGRDAKDDDTSALETTANAIRPRDAKLVLSGGFGSVMIGAIEAGNGIIGLGGAGAPVYGLDNGTTIAAASNTDLLRYTTPTMSGFNVYVSALDAVGGQGMEQAATTQDATQVGINYAAGPLKVAADITNYGTNSATGTLADSRTRISASYNLGVANVGVGYQDAETTTGVNKTERLVGVAVPMGAITVGMNYATSKTEGVAGTNKGTDLGAKYDLSKRTNIVISRGEILGKTYQRAKVVHSF